MKASIIVIMLIFVVPLVYLLVHNFSKGLCFAALLCVALPRNLILVTPGSFPDFTIYRIMLIIVFLIWFYTVKPKYKISEIPFIGFIIFFITINLISLVTCVDSTYGIKKFLSVVIEMFTFYFIIVTSIQYKQDILRMLKWLCIGLSIVAFLAVVERYTGFNPADSLVPSYIRPPKVSGDIMATYPHRILLGTAMAMGWPLSLALIDCYKSNHIKQFGLWLSTILLFSGCYFAMSRGPWLALIIGIILMFILGNTVMKKRLSFICMLIMLVLIVKPGIVTTFYARYLATMDSTTLKGSSYAYRWELWKIAYSEISKSPWRTLFGYGPGSEDPMDFNDTLLSYSGEYYDVISWDNNYSLYLLELGIIGFLSIMALYFAIIKRLLMTWRTMIRETDRNIVASIITSIAVLLFMMTNVHIFAPQLNYLFWILISIGTILGNTSNSFQKNNIVK